MADRIISNVYIRSLEAASQSSEAVDLSEGRVEVSFTGSAFQHSSYFINGGRSLSPLDYSVMIPPQTYTFVIQVPPHLFSYPGQHIHYIQSRIASNLFSLMIDTQNRNINSVARIIASFVMRQFAAGAGAGRSRGYSIVAEVGILLSSVRLDETSDEVDRESMIRNLIEKWRFVAREADDDEDKLGTCGICIEDFSSSIGAELLRMDCSHIYHRDCMMPWLAKSNTCPACRSKLY